MKQNFVLDQKVTVRRLGDGGEYRARIVGIQAEHPEIDFYIIEIVDQFPNTQQHEYEANWTHVCMTEACLDPGWPTVTIDMLRALKKIADPHDDCHGGTGGPWQDLAQEAFFGRTIEPEEWYTNDGRLTINQLLEKDKL